MFFHGDKSQLLVDKSMAFKWVKEFEAMLAKRNEFAGVNLDDRNVWNKLTETQQLSSILTDELLAKYDAELAQYGYSLSRPGDLFHPTAFPGLSFGSPAPPP